MPRIPPVTRQRVKPELQDIFDQVSSGPGGVGTGPMSILKHSPELARRAIPLFEYVRNESSVPHRLRELAMLVTARAMDCPYIWDRHAPIARQAGLSDALVDALRDKRPLPPLSADETAVLNYSTSLLQHRRVDPKTFQTVLDLLGAQGLVELTTLIGFYAMLALNANAVELALPQHVTEPPLPV
jgi:4-carboxymuconolactone decarboxylase